ncbi:hypothetical protein DFQ29_009530, partial [Apophysomyces sp. BC1021]
MVLLRSLLPIAACISLVTAAAIPPRIIYDDLSGKNISSVIYRVGPQGVKQVSYEEHRERTLAGMKRSREIKNLQKRGVAGSKRQYSVKECKTDSYDEHDHTQYYDKDYKRASQNLDCNVDTCDVMKSEMVTVSEIWQIQFNIGFSAKEKNTVTAGATLGYTWQKSWSNTESYTYHIHNGDSGYLATKILMQDTVGVAHQTCEEFAPFVGRQVSHRDLDVYAASATGEVEYVFVYKNHGKGKDDGKDKGDDDKNDDDDDDDDDDDNDDDDDDDDG